MRARLLRSSVLVAALVGHAACGETATIPSASPTGERDSSDPAPSPAPPSATGNPNAGTADGAAPPPARDPVVFVHGIKGSSAEFKVMIDRLVADGWPKERLSAIDFPDPDWGCNVDNAEIVKTQVEKLRAETGAAKIDLVAHSMGTLSTRRFVKILGGAAVVSTYVTLGGMHHGIQSACLNPLPVCVWQELCGSKPYLTELNTAPVTPGPARWVSIFSRSDDTVDPESAELAGAENIAFDGVEHAGSNGLLERPEVYAEVKRVLEYPNP